MKRLFTALFIVSLTGGSAIGQVSSSDSLALVDLYNSTSGGSWSSNTNWLSANPVSTWYGVEIAAGRVSSIDLRNNNLSGAMPATLTSLTGLYTLILGGNSLTGPIPSDIGVISNLQRLVLNDNSLSGSIPTTITNLTNLYELNLVNCGLTGGVPSNIGNMTALQYVWLNGNSLGGSIPASIMNLNLLKALALNGNGMTGSIPSGFAGISQCREIYLNNNSLSGTLPTDLGDASALEQIWLDNNNLDGSIPGSMLNLSSLKYLGMSNNNFTGTIHDFTGNISTIEWLFFNNNSFNKITMSASASLTYLDVSTNNLKFFQLENIIPVPTELYYSPQDSIGTALDTSIAQGADYRKNAADVTTGNSYNWSKDGSSTGITTSYYDIIGADNSDAGEYYCEITNSNWPGLTLIQRKTTVTVSCSSPVITQEPISNTITENFDISFYVLDNYGTSYQWQVNQGSGFTNLSDGGNYSGTSTNTLLISTTPISFDGYTYRCIVTGLCSPVATSTAATLTVATAISTFTKYVKDATYGKQNLNVTTAPTTANNVYILPATRTGASYYTVQVSLVSNFSSGIMEQTGTVSTDWSFINLLPGNTYYTRASVNGGAYSSAKSFVIESSAQLVGTSKLGKTYDVTYGWQDGATNPTTSTNVYCRPTPVSGATLYTVEVNSDPGFGAATAITKSAADWSKIAPYYFNGLTPSSTYYVRVMVDIEGYWGDTRTFVTDGGAKPTARIGRMVSSNDNEEVNTYLTSTVEYKTYPNPFFNQINIRVETEEDTRLEIKAIDLTGKVVYSNNNYLTNQTIQIGEELDKGFYMVTLTHDEITKTIKVIKK